MNKPFVPELDLKKSISNGDRGMRPAVVGAWKREKDEDGFAFFMDIQRRSSFSLVQVLSIVKGMWEEDNEAVSFSKDTEGRIVKFRLNPKEEKEEEVAKKQVNVKRQGLKIIKKGTGSKPVGKNAGKQQIAGSAKPVRKLRTTVSKDGDNPFTPGFGIYLVYEELNKGGTYEQILGRVKAAFKKGGVKSNAKGRLDTAISRCGKTGQLKGFKITKVKTGKLQIVKK